MAENSMNVNELPMKKIRRKRRPTRTRNSKKNRNLPNWLRWLIRIALMLLILGGICWYVLLAVVDHQITSNTNSKHLLFYSSDLNDNSHLMVVHLAPHAQQASAYIVDGGQIESVAGGYGEYQLRAMPGLIELDHQDILTKTTLVSLTFGQTIDDLYRVDQNIQPPLDSAGLKATIRKINNEAWDGWQKFKMSRMLSIVPESRFFYYPDLMSLEAYLVESQKDYPLNVCSVAVVNSTEMTGLAKKYTQLLEKSGVTVYRTTSDQDQLTKSAVLIDDQASPDCLFTLERIKPVVMGAEIEERVDVTQDYRADIVILIGQDVADVAQPN